jgi:hypothetical protein
MSKPRESRMGSDREERIRRRAHAIWEREGKPHGSHQEHWDQATSEIDTEDAQSANPSRNVDPATVASPSVEQVTGAGPAVAHHSKDAPKSRRKPSKPK